MATRIKICGVTRPEDAELAAELGAAALGLVVWPGSPRVVDVARARDIVSGLPATILRVGVFVEAHDDSVRRIADEVDLDVVQKHDARASFAPGLDGRRRVFQLAALESDDQIAAAIAWPASVTPLVDAIDPVRRGGSGRVADWEAAARLASRRDIVLAGGLHSGNVAAAIARVRPWAVDVSSGVEDRPGVKSAQRLRAFFAAVAAADGSGA